MSTREEVKKCKSDIPQGFGPGFGWDLETNDVVRLCCLFVKNPHIFELVSTAWGSVKHTHGWLVVGFSPENERVVPANRSKSILPLWYLQQALCRACLPDTEEVLSSSCLCPSVSPICRVFWPSDGATQQEGMDKTRHGGYQGGTTNNAPGAVMDAVRRLSGGISGGIRPPAGTSTSDVLA